MKKITAFTMAAFLSGSIFAFDPSMNLQPVGEVSEYTKTDYTITERFGDYYRSPKAKYVHKFDANGKRIETSELTNKDALVDRLVFSYDDRGNLTSTTASDEDGKIMWKIVSVYNEKNQKTEESEFNASDTLVSKSIWKYPDPNQSEESYYNADGALLAKTITKTDDRGRITEENQYSANGELDSKHTFTYNDAGKLSEMNYYDGNEVFAKKVVFRFDEKGTVTEEQTYDAKNKLAERIIYKYDDKGNITRVTEYTVSEKFGGIVNELTALNEYSYVYGPAVPVAEPAPAFSDAK